LPSEKQRGSFDLQPYQNSPLLFFTGSKLHPPGIGIEPLAILEYYATAVIINYLTF